jgi:hypothetical protein
MIKTEQKKEMTAYEKPVENHEVQIGLVAADRFVLRYAPVLQLYEAGTCRTADSGRNRS